MITKTLVPYRDRATVDRVRHWFKNTYGEGTPDSTTKLDLYQSYCEFTLPKKYLRERLDPNQFAKCMVAARILEILPGRFALRDDWEPMDYELRRATLDVTVAEAEAFIDG